MGVVTGRALPPALHGANEALAFLLEIAMLAALAWWGASQHASAAVRITLAVAAPAIAVVLWGAFAAPRARVTLSLPGVLAAKVLAFGAAALGLYLIGRHALAIAFAAIAILNSVIAAMDRRAREDAGRSASH